jgi:hypothetical protein
LVAGGFDTVFVSSFCLGAIGVLILIFFVDAPATRPAARVAVRAGLALLARPDLRRVCLAAGLLGLLTVGDMFLFLAVQRSAGLPSELLPLLPLGTALTFMLTAIPVGRLADRLGRTRCSSVPTGSSRSAGRGGGLRAAYSSCMGSSMPRPTAC